MKLARRSRWTAATLCVGLSPTGGLAQQPQPRTGLDARVEDFLERNRDPWWGMNVPTSDGRALYDIVVQNGYTKALEIWTV